MKASCCRARLSRQNNARARLHPPISPPHRTHLLGELPAPALVERRDEAAARDGVGLFWLCC